MSYYNSNNYSKNRKSNFSDHPPSQPSSKSGPTTQFPHNYPNYGSKPQNFQQWSQPVYSQYNQNKPKEIPKYEIPNYGPPPKERHFDTVKDMKNNPQPVPVYVNRNPSQTQTDHKKDEHHLPKTQAMDIEPVHHSNIQNIPEHQNTYIVPQYHPPLPEKKVFSHSNDSLPIELRRESSNSMRPEVTMVPEKTKAAPQVPEDINGKHNIIKEDEDLEPTPKKIKTDSPFFDKLYVISQELNKIKEKEVSVLKHLWLPPKVEAFTGDNAKKISNLIIKEKNSDFPKLAPSLVIDHLFAHSATENPRIRSELPSLIAGPLVEEKEVLEQRSKELAQILKLTEEEIDSLLGQETYLPASEESKPVTLSHFNSREAQSSNPKFRELEDKSQMDRLDFLLREKRYKLKEVEKSLAYASNKASIAREKHHIIHNTLKKQAFQSSQRCFNMHFLVLSYFCSQPFL